MTDPDTFHDRLARLEAGVAAPIGSAWRHVWHTAGISAVVVILVLLAWLVSSVVNRYNRGKELLQAAQPITVAAAAPVLSPGELAARYNLVPAALSKAPTVDQAALRRAAAAGAAAALAAQQRQKGGPQASGPAPAAPGAGPAGVLPPAAACIPLPAPGAQFYYAEKKIDRMPRGGFALPLLNPDNTLDLLQLPLPPSRFTFGGRSRSGVQWDPVAHSFGAFVDHDLLSIELGTRESCKEKRWRCGRALVLGARPYASYSYQALPGAKASDYGVPITLAIDF